MITIGLILIVLAVALGIVGGMAALKRLPGNSYIGLRVEEVRKNKGIWDLAHAVAGPVWLFGAIILLLGGIVALSASGWWWIIPVISLIVAVISVSVGANLGAKAAFLADKAATEKEKPAVDITALRQAAKTADKKER